MHANDITVQPIKVYPRPFGFVASDTSNYVHQLPAGKTFDSLSKKKLFGLDLASKKIKVLDAIPVTGVCVGNAPTYATSEGRREFQGTFRRILRKLQSFSTWENIFGKLFKLLPKGRVGQGNVLQIPSILRKIGNALALLENENTFTHFTQTEYEGTTKLIPLIQQALEMKLNPKSFLVKLSKRNREEVATQLDLPEERKVGSTAVFFPKSVEDSRVRGHLLSSVEDPKRYTQVYKIWQIFKENGKFLTDRYLISRGNTYNFTATHYLKYDCFNGPEQASCRNTLCDCLKWWAGALPDC